MKNRSLSLITLLGSIGFVSISSGDEAEPSTQLFAAFAMTKAQQASSLPTDSGVFLRARASESWSRIGPVIQAMNSIAVDPSDPSTLFIACGNGIVRSQDGGSTWRMVTGWRESDFTRIAIDPQDGDRIYAASVWGLSVSRDGGESWQASNQGLSEKYCRCVWVDERDPRRVMLGTGNGVYESRDRAASWRAIKTSPKSSVLRMDRSLVDPNLWIIGTEGEGVYRSRNDGKTWESVAKPLAGRNIYGVSLHPRKADRMAAGGWNVGVWTSNDGGQSWNDVSSGLPSLNVTALVFDENAPERLWVSTFEEGTYYSDDNGGSWSNGDLDGAYVLDLDFVPLQSPR